MSSSASATVFRILVVDDTASIHDDFRKILGQDTTPPATLIAARKRLFGEQQFSLPAFRFQLDCVTQGNEALTCVQRALAVDRPYCVAFIDMRMPPGWDGIETTRELWLADPDIQVVICTAYSDRTWEDTVAQLGNTDNLLILKKPFDNIEVVQLAHALAAKWTMMRRDRERLADLDERVRTRTAQLRAAEGRFTRVFEANPVPTTLQGLADGTYVDANPAFVRLSGYEREAILHHTAAELKLWAIDDVWRTTLDSLARQDPLRSHAAQLRTANGSIRDVLIAVERVETDTQVLILTSVEDVTERLLLEKKLQQSQKMEAVGQLAAGIAHDFNNLLTVIQSYTTMLMSDQPAASPAQESLTQIRAAAERAAALTRQLLLFSRRQIARPEPLDVGATLMRMRDMLRRLVPESIALEWNRPADVRRVLADEAYIEQVILNLVVNARDAMPQGGTITFALANRSFPATPPPGAADEHPGDFVLLSIADTGSGMEPTVLAHIFEPFFTTKDVGKGTGLGLSTVYGIVRQHGGWIDVKSAPARGTQFDIYLPALANAPSPQQKSRSGPRESGAARGHGERILVVEDEESVRRAIRSMASLAGYEVTDAADGRSALELCAQTERPFDLLLTDMVMPNGMTGMELAARMRERFPELKVIISTGYSQELLSQNGQATKHARLFLKPYSCEALLAVIREVLDSPTP